MTRLAARCCRFVVISAIFLSSCAAPGADQGRAERDPLAAELLERRDRDQAVRQIDWGSLTEEERKNAQGRMGEVDKENTQWLKGVVEEHGWPTISMVGEEASRGAWLILQHAVAHPEFQAHCLTLMEAAAANNDVNKKNVAYMTDRVRIQNARPQVYGTQYQAKVSADGTVVRDANDRIVWLIPIVEDVAQIDSLRAAAGMGPWADYERMMAGAHRDPAPTPRQWDGKLPVDHHH